MHPIAALQSEWSLFSRDIEPEIVPTCRELGIGLVPYSPLGRGLLTGAIGARAELADDDFRRTLPRFDAENLDANLALVQVIRAVAAEHGTTPVRSRSPGCSTRATTSSRSPARSAAATSRRTSRPCRSQLTADDLARLDALRPAGERTGDPGWVNRDTPEAAR